MQELILFLTFVVLINLNNYKKNQLVENLPSFDMNVFVNVSGTQETLGDKYVQENLWEGQEENKKLSYILPLVTFWLLFF